MVEIVEKSFLRQGFVHCNLRGVRQSRVEGKRGGVAEMHVRVKPASFLLNTKWYKFKNSRATCRQHKSSIYKGSNKTIFKNMEAKDILKRFSFLIS